VHLHTAYRQLRRRLIDPSAPVDDLLCKKQKVDTVCRQLRRRLSDLSAPVADLPVAILSLSKLQNMATKDAASKTRVLGGGQGVCGAAGLLGSVRQCIKSQQMAALALMTRTVSSFHDQVLQISTETMESAKGPRAGGGGERGKVSESAVGQVSYDGLVLVLVSMLTNSLKGTSSLLHYCTTCK
jgi:hypothetical protein